MVPENVNMADNDPRVARMTDIGKPDGRELVHLRAQYPYGGAVGYGGVEEIVKRLLIRQQSVYTLINERDFFRLYEWFELNMSLVQMVIQGTIDTALSQGIDVKCKSEKVKDELLDWFQTTETETKSYQLLHDILQYGNAYAFPQEESGAFINWHLTDPYSIQAVQKDKYGSWKFSQYGTYFRDVHLTEMTTWSRDYYNIINEKSTIFHFRLYPLSYRLLGTSALRPSVGCLMTLYNAYGDLATIWKKFGAPTIIAKIKPQPGVPITKEMMSTLANDLQDVAPKNAWVLPEAIDYTIVPGQAGTVNTGILNPIENAILGSFQYPRGLFMDVANRSVLDDQLLAFYKKISRYQYFMSKDIEKWLIRRILESNGYSKQQIKELKAEFVFRMPEVDERLQLTKAQRAQALCGKPFFTRNEIRIGMFDKEPILAWDKEDKEPAQQPGMPISEVPVGATTGISAEKIEPKEPATISEKKETTNIGKEVSAKEPIKTPAPATKTGEGTPDEKKKSVSPPQGEPLVWRRMEEQKLTGKEIVGNAVKFQEEYDISLPKENPYVASAGSLDINVDADDKKLFTWRGVKGEIAEIQANRINKNLWWVETILLTDPKKDPDKKTEQVEDRGLQNHIQDILNRLRDTQAEGRVRLVEEAIVDDVAKELPLKSMVRADGDTIRANDFAYKRDDKTNDLILQPKRFRYFGYVTRESDIGDLKKQYGENIVVKDITPELGRKTGISGWQIWIPEKDFETTEDKFGKNALSDSQESVKLEEKEIELKKSRKGIATIEKKMGNDIEADLNSIIDKAISKLKAK